MRPAAKAGLVAIGYIAALAIAFLVTRIYIAAPARLCAPGGRWRLSES
jgi:hypothetical protein